MKKMLISIKSGLGAMLGIALLAYSQNSLENWQILMAPFGATAVLLYCAPQSPFSQPLNIIGGHFLTAAIGVLFVQFVGVEPWSLALAAGLAVSAMVLTNTTHPPAGANPILIMLTQPSWTFVFDPVLLGAVGMVLGAEIFKRISVLVEIRTSNSKAKTVKELAAD